MCYSCESDCSMEFNGDLACGILKRSVPDLRRSKGV